MPPVLVQFALDSAAARDAQLSLQEAHKQAKLKETDVLAAADAGTAVVAIFCADSPVSAAVPCATLNTMLGPSLKPCTT